MYNPVSPPFSHITQSDQNQLYDYDLFSEENELLNDLVVENVKPNTELRVSKSLQEAV